MSGIDFINLDDDQLCGQQRFNFMRLRNSNSIANGHEVDGGSIPGHTLAFQGSGERRELPRADVQTVGIGGNVRARLSTESHDMLDTTMVPLSRVFDCFSNMRLNGFRSDYMCHAGDRQPTKDQQIQTTAVGNAAPIIHHMLVTIVNEGGCVRTNPLITASLEESFYSHAICTQGVVGHVASSSTIAPVSHAYLCLIVTDCVIRPEIIPFPNSRLKMRIRVTYGEIIQILLVVCPNTMKVFGFLKMTFHHALDVLSVKVAEVKYLMWLIVSAANECSTLGTQQTVESGRLQTAMSDASSSIRHTPRRSSIHGETPSYIDLGDCNQQCRHCGCLFWYNERLKNNDYGRRAEYHLCCGGGKIYMPPTPDPPLFIQ
ncbi:hypothetical protein Tco_1058366 [Tanacetum coccineum]|uniref:Uncharacterized protein n=1 Tax=Tanacetum coccineum TaxID=301880 RepID=A0ABQ5H866_9ASTR